ncbi:MAG: hypothetical protein WDA16_04840 [Candidatus Thermoplasmatota archaeon]
MGFWARLEDRILALQADRARMARYFQVAYWVATAFMVFGIAATFLIWSGRWRL